MAFFINPPTVMRARYRLARYKTPRRFYVYTFLYVSFAILIALSFLHLSSNVRSIFHVVFSAFVAFAIHKRLYNFQAFAKKHSLSFVKSHRYFIDFLTLAISFIIASATILISVLMIFFIFKGCVSFFHLVPISNFLSMDWDPQSHKFGILPLLWGTVFISAVSLIFAMPISIMVAIYIAEYVRPNWKNKIKFALEILASIPTVIYGYFAAFILSKWIFNVVNIFDIINFSPESVLVSGLVIGIVIMPYMITIIDDSLRAVPRHIRENALSLGAMQSEVITKLLIKMVLPGIITAGIVALSRAIGESMIVIMAAGFMPNISLNPLEPATTATVHIVTLLTGDSEFGSEKTLAAFAIASVLFMMTLALNTISMLGRRNR